MHSLFLSTFKRPGTSFSESVIGAPERRFILPTKVFPNMHQTFSTLPAFSPAAQLLEQPGDISFRKSSKLPRNRRATQNSPSSSTAAQGVGKLSTIEPLSSPRTPSPTPVTGGTLVVLSPKPFYHRTRLHAVIFSVASVLLLRPCAVPCSRAALIGASASCGAGARILRIAAGES